LAWAGRVDNEKIMLSLKEKKEEKRSDPKISERSR
jgi:hypothetical protein